MAKNTTAEEQHEIMTKTPIPKLLVSMSIPMVLSQMMTVIYNTADTWFVAKIGTSAAAAAGVVFSIMAIIQAFGYGISMGTGSLISRLLGEKKDEEAEQIASSGVAASIVMGLLVSVLGLAFLEPLMKLLGSTETMLPYSCDYGRYIFLGAPIMCVSFVLNSIMKSEGKPVFSTVALCSGGIFNIILDPLFIFVLDLGIKGAAMATTLSQLISMLILVYGFVSGRSILKIRLRSVSRSISVYGRIISTGFPTICRQSMGSIASALLNRQASLYGDAVVAAISIATKVYVLIRNLVLGIGQGFMPIAGYNYGAGEKKRTKSAFTFSALAGTVACLLFTAFILIFSTQVITWFRDDPEVVAEGTRMIRFFCLSLPVLAYSTFVNQLYQCLGFRTAATFLASCRQGIFFIPALYILAHFFGVAGIEATQATADICTFVISVPFQIYFFRKHLSTKGDENNVGRQAL